MAIPRATDLALTGQSRWTRRLARGGESCQPSAASSGGLAAATTRTASGNARSPTTPSSTTRSMAACTAGGAVVSSSKKSNPWPAAASRRAHSGGAICTAPSMTTGSPAKSAGSLIEPITTSVGQPSASPRARTTDVLPVPGLPHSRTGTPAWTETASASATSSVSMTTTSPRAIVPPDRHPAGGPLEDRCHGSAPGPDRRRPGECWAAPAGRRPGAGRPDDRPDPRPRTQLRRRVAFLSTAS